MNKIFKLKKGSHGVKVVSEIAKSHSGEKAVTSGFGGSFGGAFARFADFWSGSGADAFYINVGFNKVVLSLATAIALGSALMPTQAQADVLCQNNNTQLITQRPTRCNSGETDITATTEQKYWGGGTASGLNATAWGRGYVTENGTTTTYTSTASGLSSTAWAGGTASGTNSTAFGASAVASGARSTAWSRGQATGPDSTAWGRATASGNNSTAWGASSVLASGGNSTAFGNQTIASGDQATAWGYNTRATLNNATAFGLRTQATNLRATAFGVDTVASGENSTAWGENSVAIGTNSTAFGLRTQATNQRATAFGVDTVASGENSTAWGENSVAIGTNSTAFGSNSKAYTTNSTAFGNNSVVGYSIKNGDNSYNKVEIRAYTQAQMQAMGHGSATKTYYYLGYTDDNGNFVKLGGLADDTELGNDAWLKYTYLDNENPTNPRQYWAGTDYDTVVNNIAQYIRNNNHGTLQSGIDSVAFGRNSFASGDNSLAAIGGFAGNGNTIAMGENAKALGGRSVAIGKNTSAETDGTVAIGGSNTSGAKAKGSGAVSIGAQSIANGEGGKGNVAIGYQAVAEDRSIKPDNKGQSVAIGMAAQAIGSQSTAVGANTVASGYGSIAMGGDDIGGGKDNATNTTIGYVSKYDLVSDYINFMGGSEAVSERT
ncbi:MAG: hypothetical protein IJP87_01540, partial [Campylobacter sp.]|nr:hypothetical protein [Campylobacter sp.]